LLTKTIFYEKWCGFFSFLFFLFFKKKKLKFDFVDCCIDFSSFFS
jgi:hypothetical protein